MTSGLHRAPRAVAFRMRCRHVIGIARFADAQQQHVVAVQRAGQPFEQRKGGSFTDRYTVARNVERTARRCGAQLQRVKTIEGRQT